jgi:diacylglycerol kinase family enzyme
MEEMSAATLIPAFVNEGAPNVAAAREALTIAGGFDVRAVGPEGLRSAVRDAVRGGARRLLVAGGDGSVASAAGEVVDTDVELAILPCGTLNHFAKDLQLPLDLVKAARVATTGHGVAADAATLNGRFFLNTSSVGAYVTFVRARERLERQLSYRVASVVAAARLLARLPTFRISLHVEGMRREYVTPLVFIGVGERELKLPTLGARVAGGKPGLHVMVVRRRSGARTLALALAAIARGVEAVARTPAMDTFLVSQCLIEPRMPIVALDGELVGANPPLEYRHLQGCLRVVVPNGGV